MKTRCPARHEGASCTRKRGHDGKHTTRGLGGAVLREWGK